MSIRDELDSDTQKRFDALKSEIKFIKDVGIEYIVDIGFAVDAISSSVQEYDIGLVVMGTKGDGMIHQVFGSTTLSVIKKVNCPILTVPLSAQYTGLHNIAIASDYAHQDEIKGFETLHDLSQSLQSHLHVLTLNASNRIDGKNIISGDLQLNKFFPEYDLDYHVKSTDNVENGLNQLVEEIHADMLVLIPRNRELFKRMFGKSVTKKMVLHSNLPIMALPA